LMARNLWLYKTINYFSLICHIYTWHRLFFCYFPTRLDGSLPIFETRLHRFECLIIILCPNALPLMSFLFYEVPAQIYIIWTFHIFKWNAGLLLRTSILYSSNQTVWSNWNILITYRFITKSKWGHCNFLWHHQQVNICKHLIQFSSPIVYVNSLFNLVFDYLENILQMPTWILSIGSYEIYVCK